jgi:hypothetical protein
VSKRSPDKESDDQVGRMVLGYIRKLPRSGSGNISPEQQALMASRYAEQARITDIANRAAHAVTDAKGTPGWMRFWYASFGRAVMKLWRSCSSHELAGELAALRLKWTLRGLNPSLMAEVESAVTEALAAEGVERTRG